MTDTTPAPIGAPVPRYKIGYRSDEWGERSSTPGGIPDPAGAWVRYDDHAAALASAAQPADVDADRAMRVQAAPAAVAGPVAYRVLRKRHDGEWVTDGRAWCDGVPTQDLVDDIAPRSDGWRIEYAFAAATTQATPQREVFDEDGFRAWVIRNLPDNTIIGNSAWWADHLAAWVQRFMLAAPQPAPVAQGDARAEQALLKVLAAVQRYLPPDGPSAKDTMSEIIGIVDPWPLGDLKGKA